LSCAVLAQISDAGASPTLLIHIYLYWANRKREYSLKATCEFQSSDVLYYRQEICCYVMCFRGAFVIPSSMDWVGIWIVMSVHQKCLWLYVTL